MLASCTQLDLAYLSEFLRLTIAAAGVTIGIQRSTASCSDLAVGSCRGTSISQNPVPP
jgi:hypothetical protein